MVKQQRKEGRGGGKRNCWGKKRSYLRVTVHFGLGKVRIKEFPILEYSRHTFWDKAIQCTKDFFFAQSRLKCLHEPT